MSGNRHAATVFEEKENAGVRIGSLFGRPHALLAQVPVLVDLTHFSFRYRCYGGASKPFASLSAANHRFAAEKEKQRND